MVTCEQLILSHHSHVVNDLRQIKRIILNLRYISWQYCKMYLYQNQSIGRELTASDTNCNVTLSLKTSNMIKMDRF